jgi:hypothetical protein
MPVNATTRAAVRRVLQRRAIQAQATQPVHGRRTSSRGTHSVPLTAEAKAKIQYALEHAWADSTIEKYSQSLEAYHRFCDKQVIPASFRLPASEELLCAFAASRVGEVAGGTARSAAAAVKAWHIIHDAPWKGGLRLRYTLYEQVDWDLLRDSSHILNKAGEPLRQKGSDINGKLGF